VGRLLGGSDETDRDLATTLFSWMLYATPPAAAAAAAEVARQPGALPGLIAAAGSDTCAVLALNVWRRLVEAGVEREDLARGVAEAGARGALRRVAGAAGRLLASDDPAKDEDFSAVANGLAALCRHEPAAAAVAANAGVMSALRRALRSSARAKAGMRLLLALRSHSTSAPAAGSRRDGGKHCSGGGDGGEGGGTMRDPQLLVDVVRAAASEDVRVCLLAFRFIGYGDGVWSVPLMAPVAVSALRKLYWELTE
jgi:hypothetical protein